MTWAVSELKLPVQHGREDDGLWAGGATAGQKSREEENEARRATSGTCEEARATEPRAGGRSRGRAPAVVPAAGLHPGRAYLIRSWWLVPGPRGGLSSGSCQGAVAECGPWPTLPRRSSPGSFVGRGPCELSWDQTSVRCPVACAAHGRAAVCRRQSSCSSRATPALTHSDGYISGRRQT